jgi:predicted RNA-binding Zn-ribbon protein involved in translation (DUF1610 family)
VSKKFWPFNKPDKPDKPDKPGVNFGAPVPCPRCGSKETTVSQDLEYDSFPWKPPPGDHGGPRMGAYRIQCPKCGFDDVARFN